MPRRKGSFESRSGFSGNSAKIRDARFSPPDYADSILALARDPVRRQRLAVINEDRQNSVSLSGFIRRAWPVLEPGNDYEHGWHIDAMADHLTASANGEIQRLIINVPPGTMKSMTVSVFFPMWLWGPFARPWTRIIGMSHKESLSVRDNMRCRRLAHSDWYQDRWPLALVADQNEKHNFENVQTGFRQVATKNITGKRGDFILIDDPISVDAARSVVEREAINEWFRESLPTRMNDQEKSVIILIMQRVHEDDPTGMILAKNLGYEHLMLPMRYEPDRTCVTSIGFQDPRTKAGDLLFPARFSEFAVQRLEREMTPYSVAGQLQQRPVPRDGAMFKKAWFKPLKEIPKGTRFVRYWDLAATEEQFGAEPAWTAGLKLGRMPDGRYVIADVNRLRAEGAGVRRMIMDTAREDTRHCEIGLPQDPGQSGKVQAQDMVAMLSGYIVRAERETGDKMARAEPVAAQAEAGNIFYLEGQDWWPTLEAELTTFPGSRFKDQVDALSGAFSRLMNSNLFGVSEEQIAVEPIRIASLWGRCAAIDIGPKAVTIVWAFFNRTTDTMYVYDVYQAPKSSMPLHASLITQSNAKWVPVLFDLQANGSGKEDGINMAHTLSNLGVDIMVVKTSTEANVTEMASRLMTRRLRVFETVPDWFTEYRRFGRDEAGKIPDENTAIMRLSGILSIFGTLNAVTENRAMSDAEVELDGIQSYADSGADPVTGY